ncbi:MAG TPA: hypothetical protein VHC95_11935 [Opitutales bacterium]|nr:hypothetical protein [Opitutales bacterium]
MPIDHAIWKIGEKPEALPVAKLTSEQLLETMIVADPKILSDEWMLIGQQEQTDFRGRIDLLAIAPDGSLILIELKRHLTPREIVAQSLDYASWVEKLAAKDISSIYSRFTNGRSLQEDFRRRFGRDLNEDSLNQSHQIVIVAAEMDDSTERIIDYLSERKIPINVVFFKVFRNGANELLSRAWLIDPIKAQISAASTSNKDNEPWNGEFYVSFGAEKTRSWEDARRYGFISGGGAPWYSRTLKLLKLGDRVWVNIPQTGYVGVGRVTGRAQSASEFVVKTANGDIPIKDAELNAEYGSFIEDLELCEYFVPIQWLQTVSQTDAVWEIGFFGNQNTVCRPTDSKWRHTVEKLKSYFKKWNN